MKIKIFCLLGGKTTNISPSDIWCKSSCSVVLLSVQGQGVPAKITAWLPSSFLPLPKLCPEATAQLQCTLWRQMELEPTQSSGPSHPVMSPVSRSWRCWSHWSSPGERKPCLWGKWQHPHYPLMSRGEAPAPPADFISNYYNLLLIC